MIALAPFARDPLRPESHADLIPCSIVTHCASSEPLRLVQPISELQFVPQFISGKIRRQGQIVLEPALQGFLFLFLSPLADFFSSAIVNVRWRHIADPFVITPIPVKFDELRHGRPQSLRAGEHQQVQSRLERLVEALQLAVGLRVVGRAVNVPDLEHRK